VEADDLATGSSRDDPHEHFDAFGMCSQGTHRRKRSKADGSQPTADSLQHATSSDSNRQTIVLPIIDNPKPKTVHTVNLSWVGFRTPSVYDAEST
jgi:hypothetical protein